MNQWTTTLDIGASAPFTLLHISDTHLALADDLDDDRKHALARHQSALWTGAEESLREVAAIAQREKALIAHTGDLIDFVSHANLEAAAAFHAENDCFLCAGNHEFSQYVGEAWEDADYRNQSLQKVQSTCRNDIRFAVREVNGVNIVALDNGYYLIEENQLAALKAVCAEGKPVILMMHVPIYEPQVCAERRKHGGEAVYLMTAPEEILRSYNDHRRRQQTPDETTLAARDFILSEKNIRAILTGHLHFDFVSRLTGGLTQYVAGRNSVHRVEIR